LIPPSPLQGEIKGGHKRKTEGNRGEGIMGRKEANKGRNK
jgi:hypothetical protein